MSSELEKPIVGEVKAAGRWRMTTGRLLAKIPVVLGRLPKQIKLAVLVVALVVVGLFGLKIYHTKQQQSRAPLHVCSDQILKESAKYLGSNKVIELKKVIPKIQTLKNYDKDPNCLNPIATYYINISYYENAKLYMDKIERRYDARQGFSSLLGGKAKSIEILRANLASLKDVQKINRQNQRLAPQP